MTAQKNSEATIETKNVNGKTVVSTLMYSYPLKFHSVSNPSKQLASLKEPQHTSAWLYEVNFGGGLVSGDNININVNVGANTTTVLTGQSSMKIYRSKAESQQGEKCSQHHLNATVEENGLLCLAFPPVTCYKGANYKQSQTIKLVDESAGAIFVEWMTSGRVAMGESWDFESFQTENEVWIGDELLIREAVRLSNDDAPPTVKERMNPYTNVVTIVIVGERLMTYAEAALKEVNKRQIESGKKQPRETPSQICSASELKRGKDRERVREGEEKVIGTVVKAASETSNEMLSFVNHIMGGVWSEVLGANPYK